MALEVAEESAILTTRPIKASDVLDGQRRTAPFHYNVTARHEAGAKLGIRSRRAASAVRWHERAAARMAIKDYLAHHHIGGPHTGHEASRRWLKFKLYVLKGLESLS